MLEEVVDGLLSEEAVGVVRIGGRAGSGKRTALASIVARAAWAERVVTLDRPERHQVLERCPDRLVIYTRAEPLALVHLAEYNLAPWDEDDRLEYLLARHPERCASVLTRVSASGHIEELMGSPELWCPVLDELAADERVVDVDAALSRVLDRAFGDPQRAARLRMACVRARTDGESLPPFGAEVLEEDERFARHAAVQDRLGAVQVTDDLSHGELRRYLAKRFPSGLLRATSQRIAGDEEARSVLERLVEEGGNYGATAASLLNAADTGWVVSLLERLARASRPLPDLTGADLSGARAAGAQARGMVLDRARCAGGDWNDAQLDRVRAVEADFGVCLMRGVRMNGCMAQGASFEGADLRGASLVGSHLDGVVLRGARLDGADLSDSTLRGVQAEGARLCGAKLADARLGGAHLDGADLRAASLVRASMRAVDLRRARLDGADLSEAMLAGANLEGLELPQARFAGVLARGAYFTGSVMSGADFQGADLRETGLAQVAWEGADLRGANLTDASFQLGSTRSGKLVGYPSEGTRTGFYTDDYDDQNHKVPEEIRKANLVGADLRGAHVQGTDFYLVDLRGVRCSDKQREHFRRCGAILAG